MNTFSNVWHVTLADMYDKHNDIFDNLERVFDYDIITANAFKKWLIDNKSDNYLSTNSSEEWHDKLVDVCKDGRYIIAACLFANKNDELERQASPLFV